MKCCSRGCDGWQRLACTASQEGVLVFAHCKSTTWWPRAALHAAVQVEVHDVTLKTSQLGAAR
ncbi:hypothetical protein E2C01_062346 [Portunus trituberculatus]|uniref:Uncharacterized protein n=1 Tax=Portunus trituberculatus TaxID=210409 RepID=A0A5B7HED9_PORTR|nr:hypothetical protein [Portunus trituberculatus]